MNPIAAPKSSGLSEGLNHWYFFPAAFLSMSLLPAFQRPFMLELTPVAAPAKVLSVGELNALARAVVEQQIPLTWVAGEVSNFKRYDSGHCYFTLKDENAQVDCVMFRSKAM